MTLVITHAILPFDSYLAPFEAAPISGHVLLLQVFMQHRQFKQFFTFCTFTYAVIQLSLADIIQVKCHFVIQ